MKKGVSNLICTINPNFPLSAFMAFLFYFDACRSAKLLRTLFRPGGFFRAHQHERIDPEGTTYLHELIQFNLKKFIK
jgi:6-phosphogluconate dehydrogenase